MKLQVSAIGLAKCQGCGTHATLRTIEVEVRLIPARKGQSETPPGWCPLIALCGICWTEVRTMLREKATLDSSGTISPP